MTAKTITRCAVAAAVVALLAGCEAEIMTPVTMNELSQPLHEVSSTLDVQISSCQDMNDKRLESDDLIKIRQRIGLVFPKAQYQRCYQKDFSSIAQFRIPVTVGLREKGSKVQDREVSVSTDKDSDGDLRVTLRMGEGVQRELTNLKSNSFVDITPKVVLALEPGETMVKALIPSAFVNGEPYHNLSCKIQPNKGTYRIGLSDAGVAQALTDGFARILTLITPKQ